MNSIYNDDIAIRNSSKNNNDNLQSLKDQVDDWQESALAMCDERDRLRVMIAKRDAEIDLLRSKIIRLERCVLANALHNSDVNAREAEEMDDNIVFHAGRAVHNEINHERHSQEDAIGDAIEDLKNGNY
jgi:predicted  nucleic acid-binding Zn-ribbon protein